MIERLEILKAYEQGFNKDTMRWRNITHREKHISEVDFKTLEDEELLGVFEQIVRQHWKSM